MNTMYGATGRLLGEIPLGRPLVDDLVGLTMKRSRLAVVLADEAERRGVDVRVAPRSWRSPEATDGVTAHARRTARPSTATSWSAPTACTRSSAGRIDPEAPSGRYVGLTNFGGITRIDPRCAAQLAPEAWHFVFGSGRSSARTRPLPVTWCGSSTCPRPEISARRAPDHQPEQWQHWLLELVRDDDGPAADLVAEGELELAGDNTFDLPTCRHGRATDGRDR